MKTTKSKQIKISPRFITFSTTILALLVVLSIGSDASSTKGSEGSNHIAGDDAGMHMNVTEKDRANAKEYIAMCHNRPRLTFFFFRYELYLSRCSLLFIR